MPDPRPEFNARLSAVAFRRRLSRSPGSSQKTLNPETFLSLRLTNCDNAAISRQGPWASTHSDIGPWCLWPSWTDPCFKPGTTRAFRGVASRSRNEHLEASVNLRRRHLRPPDRHGAATRVQAQDTQEYIVQFRDGTTAGARRAVAANAGASARFVYNRVAAATLRVPNGQALQALRRNPAVLSIVPNRPVAAYQSAKAKGKPGAGAGQSSQVTPGGVQRVGPPIAGFSDGAGVGVAILDTGVDLLHQDLLGTVNAFSAFGPSCQDDGAHGTHVAGIVAARDNNVDVVGVAPGATLYCVKVLDASGNGTEATLMAGLDWVLAEHANVTPSIRVINMSLGRPGTVDDNPALHQSDHVTGCCGRRHCGGRRQRLLGRRRRANTRRVSGGDLGCQHNRAQRVQSVQMAREPDCGEHRVLLHDRRRQRDGLRAR